MESIIRDIKLAKSGHEKISWVDHYMPALNAIGDELAKEQTFKGKTVCVSVHLEAKTAYLAEVLHRAGANVIVTGSNPLSTQADVAAALVEDGLTVYAWYGATEEDYFNCSIRRGPTPWKTSSAARKKRRQALTAFMASIKRAS